MLKIRNEIVLSEWYEGVLSVCIHVIAPSQNSVKQLIEAISVHPKINLFFKNITMQFLKNI